MMSASLTASNSKPSENTEPRKRLIVKLSYPPGSRKRHLEDSCGTDEHKRSKIQHSVKPIVTCYWVDSNYRINTATLSQPKENNVVENKKIIKSHVSNTVMSQSKNNNNVVENKKIIKNHVSNTVMSQPKGVKERSKLCSKSMLMVKDSSKTASVTKEMTKNQVSKTAKPEERSRTASLMVKDSSKSASVTRAEECVLKKPMECVKRRQCWLILKRILAGRDGWDLKDPRAMLDNSESKSLEKKPKPIGLNEIERKLRLYATPYEFACDMRLVFSNAMQMYPPRNHIYQIAKKFSDNFEYKLKSLKEKWEIEDKKEDRLTRLEDTKDSNMF